MSAELGKAFVQIVPSARGMTKNITSELNGEMGMAGESAGKSLGGKLVGMVKGAIIAGAIGKVFKDSIMAGASLEQSLGGVETLFKDSAERVKGYASQSFRTVGISADEYMQNVSSFSASLLQSLGGDTKKSADIANMAMVDMGDNANKMGTNMRDIQNAYQGFAKQNYTMKIMSAA